MAWDSERSTYAPTPRRITWSHVGVSTCSFGKAGLKNGYKNGVQSWQWLEYRTKHDEIIWNLSQTGTLNSSHKNAVKLTVSFVRVQLIPLVWATLPPSLGENMIVFWRDHLGQQRCHFWVFLNATCTHNVYTSFPDLTLKWNKTLSVIPADFWHTSALQRFEKPTSSKLHHMKLTLRTTNDNSKLCHTLFGL